MIMFKGGFSSFKASMRAIWQKVCSWYDIGRIRKVLVAMGAGGLVLSHLATDPFRINVSWTIAIVSTAMWIATQGQVRTLLSQVKSPRPVVPYAVFFGLVVILSVIFVPWKYSFTWERLEVSLGPVYSDASSIGLWALRFVNHSDVPIELDVVVILDHNGERFPIPAEEEADPILVGRRDDFIISRLGFVVPPGLDGRWMYSQTSLLEIREIRSGKRIEYPIAQLSYRRRSKSL